MSQALFIALWLSAVEKKPNPYDEDDVIDIEPTTDNSVEHIKVSNASRIFFYSLIELISLILP